MISVTCIERIKNKDKVIIAYTLEDENGDRFNAKPSQIRVAMLNNKINITNLKISKNRKILEVNGAHTIIDKQGEYVIYGKQ